MVGFLKVVTPRNPIESVFGVGGRWWERKNKHHGCDPEAPLCTQISARKLPHSVESFVLAMEKFLMYPNIFLNRVKVRA